MQIIPSHMTGHALAFLQVPIGRDARHDAPIAAVDAQMHVVLVADGLDQFDISVEPEIVRRSGAEIDRARPDADEIGIPR